MLEQVRATHLLLETITLSRRLKASERQNGQRPTVSARGQALSSWVSSRRSSEEADPNLKKSECQLTRARLEDYDTNHSFLLPRFANMIGNE